MGVDGLTEEESIHKKVSGAFWGFPMQKVGKKRKHLQRRLRRVIKNFSAGAFSENSHIDSHILSLLISSFPATTPQYYSFQVPAFSAGH